MKRATITFPDELEQKLNAYLKGQRTPPSLSTVVQVALDEYLENQKWAEYDVRPASGPLTITVSDEGSAASDVSINHDRYLADAIYERKVTRA
ncbi:MAG: hypothetical protein M3498_12775, partial [Deinococcota bacterium]|nr:hypothetical protein [Deinococcota bacterium]